MYNHRVFQKIAMIARWKPVHNGHLPVLRAFCQGAEQAIIGIGSANRYNLRNPFTLAETIDMLKLALEGFENYTLVPVPDLDDGARWRDMVKELLGSLDLFVTANPYVFSLLKEDYRIERPVSLVPLNERVPLIGTTARRAMARGEDWQSLVPSAVAKYILDRQLDIRFRREFGLQTLAQEVDSTPHIIS